MWGHKKKVGHIKKFSAGIVLPHLQIASDATDSIRQIRLVCSVLLYFNTHGFASSNAASRERLYYGLLLYNTRSLTALFR